MRNITLMSFVEEKPLLTRGILIIILVLFSIFVGQRVGKPIGRFLYNILN